MGNAPFHANQTGRRAGPTYFYQPIHAGTALTSVMLSGSPLIAPLRCVNFRDERQDRLRQRLRRLQRDVMPDTFDHAR